MDYCYVPYEQGPIRPPSEAGSLLVRVTRNCPWNRCEFCGIYADRKFALRTVEEVKQDIATAAAFHGAQGQRIRTAFLQDANTMIMRTRDLVEVLRFLKATFPNLERVTSYGRSHTLARRPVEELEELRDAGLSRIHVGLETGCADLLEYVKKGCTPEDQVAAGRNVKAAGISLSEYVILGLGGRKGWRRHALETAAVLNRIDPDFIRVRTMTVRPGTPLFDKMERGEWEPLRDEEVIAEEALLIETLEGIRSRFVSDHMANLLMELDGRLPEAKERLLDTVRRYLALSSEEKQHFSVGRRLGNYTCLDDLAAPEARSQVDKAIERLRRNFVGNIDQALTECMRQML